MNLHSTLKYLGMLFLITTLICCKNKSKLSIDTSNPADKNYTKVEIYCWCFSSNNFETTFPCTTPKGIIASELIKRETLFRIINGGDTLERLKTIIFDTNKRTEENLNPSDSRFLFLFRINDFKADTINVFSDSILQYNNRYYFNYSFNIMDSIKVILNKKEIYCKPNDVRLLEAQ